MAQIVLIDTGTLNTEVNAIDDIVEIQANDVELTGPGYAGYRVIFVAKRNLGTIRDVLNSKHPEKQTAVNIPVANQWCFMEEKRVWKNASGLWCDLINRPKYPFSFQDITEAERDDLADEEVTIPIKNAILDKIVEKIHLDAENNVEVADLNP